MKKILLIVSLFSLYSCQKKESVSYPETIKSKDCGASDFNTFFTEFAKDSIFQKDHIKFPLRSSYLDYESHYNKSIVELIKDKGSYRYIDFSDDENAMQYETGKFTTQTVKSRTKATYRLLGYDNGIRVTYEFEFIDNCWNMVAIIDEST